MIMMGIKAFMADESGVENAVYGILMIAIVVMVALLIASLVLSQGGQIQVLASSPKAGMTGVLEGGPSPTVLINHESGDPIQISQLVLNVYDDDGVLIGTTTLSSLATPPTPSQLSPGMQSSPIALNLSPGKSVDRGARYSVKVVSSQTRQQIGTMMLVAR
jgi:FlaG/FlaF family flagellin (archaellin)